MISLDREQLREYILQVIKEDIQIHVEHSKATTYDHAKIRVSVSIPNSVEPWLREEILYTEDRIYES